MPADEAPGDGIDRRDFLLAAAGLAVGSASIGGGSIGSASVSTRRTRRPGPRGALLDVAPSDSPIDTIVVLMMENRSFDHYLGWLGTDDHFLDAGRRRYGKHFKVDGRTDLAYVDPDGKRVKTSHLRHEHSEVDPFRGCGHPIPGHGWFAGRLQITDGFLAAGTGNDEYALGYYDRDDLPVHARLADRFTVLDRSFASLSAGTFPNRQYLHAATSAGDRHDPGPLDDGIFKTETIEDRLMAAQVPVGYYYTDIPTLLLWGDRFRPIIHSIDTYFEQCAVGSLPNVVLLSPGFLGPLRSDDHSDGDVRIGQRFIREVFNAFVESPQWEHGLFVLTYDEWGGFFDHVKPPIFADDRANADLAVSFGLGGFRVPTVLASPYARRGFVDHTVYDHTSILRMIEWRFLGAPPHGPGTDSDRWYLTFRDRNANNMGSSLGATHPEVELGYDRRIEVEPFTAACPPGLSPPFVARAEQEHPDPFTPRPSLEALLARDYPSASHTPWAHVDSS